MGGLRPSPGDARVARRVAPGLPGDPTVVWQFPGRSPAGQPVSRAARQGRCQVRKLLSGNGKTGVFSERKIQGHSEDNWLKIILFIRNK